MTAYETCFNRVCDILREDCGVSDDVVLKPELALQGDLALDSIGLLNLVGALEDEYDLRLDEPLASPPETLKEIVEWVLTLQSGAVDG